MRYLDSFRLNRPLYCARPAEFTCALLSEETDGPERSVRQPLSKRPSVNNKPENTFGKKY